MSRLADRKCRPCEGGVEPLTREQADELLRSLHGDWTLSDDARAIAREFRLVNWSRTLAFANAVGWIATVEGHHPVLRLSYDRCRVGYSTHAIDGLSSNDFICAAKVDRLAADL